VRIDAELLELVRLILHQRDQRRNHHREAGKEKGGELIGQRFPGTGRHDRERIAPLVADRADVPRDVKIGTLSDEQVERLAKVVGEVVEHTPVWMRNRQNDYDTGADLHNIGNEIEIAVKDDINRLKKIRAYRGVRHELGLRVRGQRTRSNNRTGITVGVQRKK
jgi:small subunit ribosomal protein S13